MPAFLSGAPGAPEGAARSSDSLSTDPLSTQVPALAPELPLGTWLPLGPRGLRRTPRLWSQAPALRAALRRLSPESLRDHELRDWPGPQRQSPLRPGQLVSWPLQRAGAAEAARAESSAPRALRHSALVLGLGSADVARRCQDLHWRAGLVDRLGSGDLAVDETLRFSGDQADAEDSGAPHVGVQDAAGQDPGAPSASVRVRRGAWRRTQGDWTLWRGAAQGASYWQEVRAGLGGGPFVALAWTLGRSLECYQALRPGLLAARPAGQLDQLALDFDFLASREPQGAAGPQGAASEARRQPGDAPPVWAHVLSFVPMLDELLLRDQLQLHLAESLLDAETDPRRLPGAGVRLLVRPAGLSSSGRLLCAELLSAALTASGHAPLSEAGTRAVADELAGLPVDVALLWTLPRPSDQGPTRGVLALRLNPELAPA